MIKIVVALLVVAFCSEGYAAIILQPPGLNPGDLYRLVFVTSGTRDATSSNIADYNSFVTAQANQNPALQALGTNWRAIGSTISIDARDNTFTNPADQGVEIFNLGGEKVAVSNADFWDDSLMSSISVDQLGAFTADFVGTGTSNTGELSPGSTLGSDVIQVGASDSTGNAWVSLGFGDDARGWRFYGISDVLTAVPEPGSLLMVGLGTFVLSIARRRTSNA